MEGGSLYSVSDGNTGLSTLSYTTRTGATKVRTLEPIRAIYAMLISVKPTHWVCIIIRYY